MLQIIDVFFLGKRKLSENQSSEQEMKRQISRDEQLGHGVPDQSTSDGTAVRNESRSETEDQQGQLQKEEESKTQGQEKLQKEEQSKTQGQEIMVILYSNIGFSSSLFFSLWYIFRARLFKASLA